MRMHGIVFLFIGGAVSLISYVLQQQGHKMTLFIYVGIAMAVYGLLRMYIDKSEAPESTEQRRAKMAADLPQGQRSLGQIPRVCGMCNTKNHPRANFCGHCGNRL